MKDKFCEVCGRILEFESADRSFEVCYVCHTQLLSDLNSNKEYLGIQKRIKEAIREINNLTLEKVDFIRDFKSNWRKDK